jgi:hypothetical protein
MFLTAIHGQRSQTPSNLKPRFIVSLAAVLMNVVAARAAPAPSQPVPDQRIVSSIHSAVFPSALNRI